MGRANRRRASLALLGAVAGAVLLGSLAPPPASAAEESSSVRVIVQGGADAAEATVAGLGGQVVEELDLIDGLVAQVPAAGVDALRATPGVTAVTADGTVELLGKPKPDEEWADETALGGPFVPKDNVGSLYNVARQVEADDVFGHHVTGRGIGVAVIDSGISPVTGLAGKIINGPDLSFDSQDDSLRYLDAYGHGTHLAGIIAARDPNVPAGKEREDHYVVGIAPDAHLINVKVGASDGTVDVSQVLAAIDWVVEHRNDPGLNIRVLNLAFGTDSAQDPRLDPLSFAVEQAWRSGIVVVVSAGNSSTVTGRLDSPATNPYVIAVGAADPHGTRDVKDDTAAEFSSRGNATRGPDLVAPGTSIASLRTPGSHAEVDYPGAITGGRFFRGSGTSQAAAVVSGAAALLLSDRPGLTPDQVKALLIGTARELDHADSGVGGGMLDVHEALHERTPVTVQTHARATGLGSLEAARGSEDVEDLGVELIGEQDIFGLPWEAQTWTVRAANGTAWEGGVWLGRDLTGTNWVTSAQGATSWAARSWRDASWAARSWRTDDWNARSWRARSWRARSWRSNGWDAGI